MAARSMLLAEKLSPMRQIAEFVAVLATEIRRPKNKWVRSEILTHVVNERMLS